MFKKDRSKRKKKKVLLFPSTPLEVSSLEAFFERMSEDGFLVTGAYGAFYFFEEAEPKKRKFYVDYFYKASSMDINLAPATEDYLDYCRNTSWNHAFSHRKMQCFYNEDLDAPGIDTEDEFRFHSLYKAALLEILPIVFTATVFGFMSVQFIESALSQYTQFSFFLSSTDLIGLVLPVLMLGIDSIVGISRITAFHLKNRKALMRGDGLVLTSPEKGEKIVKARFYSKALLFIPLTWILLDTLTDSSYVFYSMGILAGLLLLYTGFTKTRFSSRKANFFMLVLMTYILMVSSTFVVSQGSFDDGNIQGYEILSMEELGYPAESGYKEEEFIDKESGLLASHFSYYKGITWDEYPVSPNDVQDILPFYEVSSFESSVPWVIGKYQELFMKDVIIEESIEEQYPDLIERGYEGVVLKQHPLQRARMFLRKDHSILVVSTHEPFSEDKVLQILELVEVKH